MDSPWSHKEPDTTERLSLEEEAFELGSYLFEE